MSWNILFTNENEGNLNIIIFSYLQGIFYFIFKNPRISMKLYRKWLRHVWVYSRIWVCLQRVVLYQLSTWHNPKRKRKQGGVLPGHKNPVNVFCLARQNAFKKTFWMPRIILMYCIKVTKHRQSKIIFQSFKKWCWISHSCGGGFLVSHLAYVHCSRQDK